MPLFNYRPRNDMVLLSVRKRAVSQAGLVMPEKSAEGTESHVEVVGPLVFDVKLCDWVILGANAANLGNVFTIPMEKDLICVKQVNVLLVCEEGFR